MKHLLLIVGLSLASLASWAQCTTPSLSSQDCKGAIPLCGFRYTYPSGTVCGPGAIEDEIPTGSCLSANEKNTTWYVFTVRKPGLLKYAIVPLDDSAASDSGEMDYDWALFKLPAGAANSASVCAQLTNNLSWQVSCNYAAGRGATGMLDTNGTSATNVQTASGTKWNPPLTVAAGETYVLAVDNFTGGDDLIGYTIRFRDTLDVRTGPDSTTGIASIQPTNEAFYFQFVDNQTNSVVLTTTRMFQCSRMVPSAVKVINPNNLSQQYTVTSFASEGSCATGFNNKFRLTYTPYDASASSALKLVIQDTIIDICGTITARDTLLLRAGQRTGIKRTVAATLGGFTIFPQPNKGNFQLDLRELSGQACAATIREAVSGREVWTAEVRGGEVNAIEPKRAIAPGVYLIEVTQGTRRMMQKMVVER